MVHVAILAQGDLSFPTHPHQLGEGVTGAAGRGCILLPAASPVCGPGYRPDSPFVDPKRNITTTAIVVCTELHCIQFLLFVYILLGSMLRMIVLLNTCV